MSVIFIDDVDHALIQHAAASMEQSLAMVADEIADNIETDTPHCGIDCNDACRALHRSETDADITALIALQLSSSRVHETAPDVYRLNLQTPRIARVLVDALDLLDLEDEPIPLLYGHVDVELTPDEVQQRSAALFSATMKAWTEVLG